MEMRLEYNEIFKKVSDFITWKNTEDGRKGELPKLEESHKRILFASSDSQLKEAEKATTDAAAITNIIIENINENLHGANLVAKSILGFLPDSKQLEQQWKHVVEEKVEVIRQMMRLDWEAYWQHLVKPRSQWMTL